MLPIVRRSSGLLHKWIKVDSKGVVSAASGLTVHLSALSLVDRCCRQHLNGYSRRDTGVVKVSRCTSLMAYRQGATLNSKQ